MHRESRIPIQLDISAIMQSVLVLLERTITKSGIAIRTHLEPDTYATGYPAELRQVFTNLLTNAADASAEGTTIEVKVYNQEASRSGTLEASRTGGAEMHAVPGVIISVSDHGTGIAPGVLNDLFRPFFTTKGERGSGLGLWISKGIIEKHAGTIHVVSTVATQEAPNEHGTVFTIFLPRGLSMTPPAAADARQRQGEVEELEPVAVTDDATSTSPDASTARRRSIPRRKLA